MPTYKVSPGPKGRQLFFKAEEGKGFKMISKSSIPEDVLSTMELQKPVNDQAPEFRKCIFCGALGTEQKFINGEMIDLCLNDYQSRTTGEVVERLREGVANPV
jgi:hypothetical protein